MDHSSLDTMDAEQLRALALDAWRRAEAETRRAERLKDEVCSLTEKNTVLSAKSKALEGEVTVLMRRISLLVRKLAKATSRDEQLELDLELHRLRERLANYNREIFGTSSERRIPKDDAASDEKKKKKTGHGPTPQPNLPIEEIEHTLDDPDCCCPKCGKDLKKMARQFEETELISSVKVRYVLQKHKQQKYHCGGCGHIEAAIGPLRLVPGGRYDLSFAVEVAVSKYLEHLPLDRQAVRMGRRGLRVTSQTLWDQLYALYLVLLPTLIALQARVLLSPLLHVDETRWRVMGKGGRGKSAKWWLWTMTSERGVVFDILPTRGSAAAKVFLRDYSGIVSADGYGVYASLEKALDRSGGSQVDLETGESEVLPNFVRAGCWMHARRPFFQTKESVPEANVALDLIGKLYAIEAMARENAGEDPTKLKVERARLRATESRPVIEELKLWREAQRALPGTKFAKGLTFLKNQWEPLIRFLDDPQIPLDNGEAERKIRGPVVGRKNFGGSQSERGTRAGALFYSLLMSATQLGVNPHEYLMAAAKQALRDPGSVLLPHAFAETVEQAEG